MQTTHKTKKTLRTIITGNLLILSLLTLSSCSEGGNNITLTDSATKSAEGEITTISAETEAETENVTTTDAGTKNNDISVTASESTAVFLECASKDGENKDTLLTEDIEACVNKLSEGGLEIKEYAYEYDVDFDGKKELLCPFMGLLKIYKKSDNKIYEITAGGDGFHYAFEGLKNMQTFEDENEKYAYFYYDYDGGVMKCNVLTAIKYDGEKDMYTVENIASWGRLDYGEGEASKDSRSFFRKGWNSLDRDVGQSESDISQEEFLKIYNKYENLPAWDEYLNQE